MPQAQQTYDLIVVGGGPAGATATLFARRRGLRTLLLERASFPREKVCGDALSAKAIAILNELALLDGIRKLPGVTIRGVVFGSPGHLSTRIDLRHREYRDLLTSSRVPLEGFVIRRSVLDAFLFEQACCAADRCIDRFAVRDVVVEDGRVCGVRGRRSGEVEELEFRGRLLLGCDGANSVIARKTGLYKHDGRHLLLALRQYYENVGGLTDQIELHYVSETLPGYFWIFPMADGRANVGIGMLHRRLMKGDVNLKETLTKVMARPPFAERFGSALPLEEPVGWTLPLG